MSDGTSPLSLDGPQPIIPPALRKSARRSRTVFVRTRKQIAGIDHALALVRAVEEQWGNVQDARFFRGREMYEYTTYFWLVFPTHEAFTAALSGFKQLKVPLPMTREPPAPGNMYIDAPPPWDPDTPGGLSLSALMPLLRPPAGASFLHPVQNDNLAGAPSLHPEHTTTLWLTPVGSDGPGARAPQLRSFVPSDVRTRLSRRTLERSTVELFRAFALFQGFAKEPTPEMRAAAAELRSAADKIGYDTSVPVLPSLPQTQAPALPPRPRERAEREQAAVARPAQRETDVRSIMKSDKEMEAERKAEVARLRRERAKEKRGVRIAVHQAPFEAVPPEKHLSAREKKALAARLEASKAGADETLLDLVNLLEEQRARVKDARKEDVWQAYKRKVEDKIRLVKARQEQDTAALAPADESPSPSVQEQEQEQDAKANGVGDGKLDALLAKKRELVEKLRIAKERQAQARMSGSVRDPTVVTGAADAAPPASTPEQQAERAPSAAEEQAAQSTPAVEAQAVSPAAEPEAQAAPPTLEPAVERAEPEEQAAPATPEPNATPAPPEAAQTEKDQGMAEKAQPEVEEKSQERAGVASRLLGWFSGRK